MRVTEKTAMSLLAGSHTDDYQQWGKKAQMPMKGQVSHSKVPQLVFLTQCYYLTSTELHHYLGSGMCSKTLSLGIMTSMGAGHAPGNDINDPSANQKVNIQLHISQSGSSTAVSG